ncbi:hypothetical protein FRC08_000532 [Ceratobasidium sp. 394]|nr:hypothetical protein FRC08_000532 [Ceratobasidium sp. 394]
MYPMSKPSHNTFMSATPEDFDDHIDGITAVIGEIQRVSRQISVQKAQCSKVIILCHEVVNKLREAEDDPNIMAAVGRCNELVKMLRLESTQWLQQLDTSVQGLGLLLVPIIDQGINTFMEKLLDYTKIFPSIFAAVQHKKWLADLDKSRMRDATSNKSQLQALVDCQDGVLISVLGNNELRTRLQAIAQEFDMLDDLNSVVPIMVGSGTTGAGQSSRSTTLSTPDAPQQTTTSNNTSCRSYQSKQDSLDIIWSTISKLEEHVGGDPAFEAQMEQLRKVAQAAMITTDEAVGRQAQPNLLKHTAVITSPAPATPSKPRLEISLPSARIDLSLAQIAQESLQISPEPSLLAANLRNTHVLEYIKQNPSSNRFRLCTGISQGLAHMHSLDIVLGDFTPWNITVDEQGNVRLRELNLSDSADGRPARGTWRSQLPDARYIPPEVITLPPEEEGATDPNPRKSDVYAFTLLIYEILSGVAPWDKLDIPSIVSQVTRGNRPGRPSPSVWLDNDNFWALLQQGWDQRPENRPT